MSAVYRIGTSGWHYRHWRGPFYPDGLPVTRMLAYYCRYFDTVEINNSFYQLPLARTLAGWRAATPPGFCFAAKGSRFITHMKKLKEPAAALARLLPVLEALEEKRGPLLFQLPPRWGRDAGRLAAFLAALPPGGDYAFEFRDPSWHHPEIYALLRQHNSAFCIFDLAGFCSPLELTADFAYVRLHGPDGPYAGSYGAEAIAAWAAQLRAWRPLRAVYVYFDNDQAAHAVHNALALKRLLAE
ncbi:MAG: DUF72 domain-containing protein [Pseudomonadota bacterium]|uniref:DUF72 domain-containing protein n=1 Tax=Thermithiobacillus tepidarius TaxID=929 RepID=UPI00040C12C3|nr:DUF72 domain-containing protein [Thermithiobacillus tepidarius]